MADAKEIVSLKIGDTFVDEDGYRLVFLGYTGRVMELAFRVNGTKRVVLHTRDDWVDFVKHERVAPLSLSHCDLEG